MDISTLLMALSDKTPSSLDKAEEDFEIIHDTQGNSYYYPAIVDNSMHISPESRWHILRAYLSVNL